MNNLSLIYFIRLLLRNSALLIVSPILLFAIAFFITKDQPQTYESNTIVYTGIGTGSSIVSLNESNLDRFGTSVAFDNLLDIIGSRKTIEEVGLKLFTQHMILTKPDKTILSTEKYYDLMNLVPDEVKQLVDHDSFENTFEAFQEYKNKDYENFIYKLINLNHPDYSYNKIESKLKASRVHSSDMINIQYSSEDPAICYQTLKFINQTFVKYYSSIKVNQSDAVVNYFTNELAKAQERLDDAENQLLTFNINNSIINYSEQTEQITVEKMQFNLEFGSLKMQLAGIKSVLNTLEEKLSNQGLTIVRKQEVLDLRNELSNKNLQILFKEQGLNDNSGSEDESALILELSELKSEVDSIQNQLRETIEEEFTEENTIPGAGSLSQDIMNSWLSSVIEYESTNAQVIFGEEREEEYISLYREYAPMGANMKRLERKINVAEEEYMTILNSLNTAKLKQQNVELNSNIKVYEEAFFPLEPIAGKRKYILLLALVIGFFIPAFLIIVFDFFNSNIRNVVKAESLTQLEVLVSYPNLIQKKKRIKYEQLKQMADDKVIQRFMILANKFEARKPSLIINSSIHENEGKSTINDLLFKNLTESGFKVLSLTHDEIDLQQIDKTGIHQYLVDNNFYSCTQPEDLNIVSDSLIFKDYDFILIELPSLLKVKYPVNLINNSDHLFITIRANREWKTTDNNTLKDLLKITNKNKPSIILNGVDLDEIEKDLGDIPGKRGFIRIFLKKLLLFQFHSQKKLR